MSGATSGKRVGNVFIGQSVKSVTTNAFRVKLLGKRIAVGDFRMAAMESRIEASDL